MFIQTSSVWLKLLQYAVTFKQAKAYAQDQDCGKDGDEGEKSTATIRPIQEENVM